MSVADIRADYREAVNEALAEWERALKPQGIEYEVVVGGLAEIARIRNARLRNDEQVAESFVAVTTTPRTARAPD